MFRIFNYDLPVHLYGAPMRIRGRLHAGILTTVAKIFDNLMPLSQNHLLVNQSMRLLEEQAHNSEIDTEIVKK